MQLIFFNDGIKALAKRSNIFIQHLFAHVKCISLFTCMYMYMQLPLSNLLLNGTFHIFNLTNVFASRANALSFSHL